TERHVLLARRGARHPQRLEPLARQADQAREVALPEPLGRLAVAGTELFDPGSDRPGRGHGRFSRKDEGVGATQPDSKADVMGGATESPDGSPPRLWITPIAGNEGGPSRSAGTRQ